jgi:hypothetical protein
MKISLDTAAKLAEVVGGVAVVIGLFFVGMEIRGNTIAQQFTATQVLVSEYNDAISSINDKDFICIYIRATQDFKNLSQAEKIRFSILMQPVFRTFEQIHYSALHGTIDQNVYSGLQRQFAAIMAVPGTRQYWQARGDWFGDTFQEYVDGVISGSKGVDPAGFQNEVCE